MRLKKLIWTLIMAAVTVGAVTFAAMEYIPVTASPAATILPTDTDQKPQFLYAFGDTKEGKLKQPIALAVDDQGKIYVTDAGDAKVKIYLPNGQYLKSFGSPGTGTTNFRYPYGIVVQRNGDIVIADSINLNVKVFANNGTYKKTILDAKQKIRPGALAVDDQGGIYISDLLNHQIVVINSQGIILRKFKPAIYSLKYPQEVVVGQGARKFWVADSGNFAVKEIDSKGLVAKSIRGWGIPPQAFSLVRGIGVDNLNRLMVADSVNGTIHVMTPGGQELFSFNGQDSPGGILMYPSFIYTDRRGKIYITDRGTGLVQVWGYQK